MVLGRFEWVDDDPRNVFLKLYDEVEEEALAILYLLLARYQIDIKAHMKQFAPWRDQTGNARQSLDVILERTTLEMSLTLTYGVDYGYWLEYANLGLYAIIGPTMDLFIPRLHADIEAIFRG